MKEAAYIYAMFNSRIQQYGDPVRLCEKHRLKLADTLAKRDAPDGVLIRLDRLADIPCRGCEDCDSGLYPVTSREVSLAADR